MTSKRDKSEGHKFPCQLYGAVIWALEELVGKT